MEDQEDDTARARPAGGGGGPAGPGGGGAPPPRGGEAPRRSGRLVSAALGGVSGQTEQQPAEGVSAQKPGEGGAEPQPGEGGAEKQKTGVNATACFTTPQAAPTRATGCSTGKPAAAGTTAAGAAHADDAETVRPWRHFNVAAYKPTPPKPTRIITDPRRASPSHEMWIRAAPSREEVDYTIQLEKLSKSVLTIGNGLSKVCSGLGMKIVSQEEKDMAAAKEKKAIEAKKAAEDLMSVQEKELSATLNATEFKEWKNKKEEEKRKEKKDKEKERRIAVLLSIPNHMVNMSSVLDGIGEIASGSKGVVLSVGLMVRGVPSLLRRDRGRPDCVFGGSTNHCSMGTGSLGFRMALDRQVVTRAYDGRVTVVDAFGVRKETIPGALGGSVLIKNEEELNSAIFDFKSGRLTQLIDVDEKRVSLIMARNMWKILCNEQLTGLLRPGCALPEMALRASALINEEAAVEYHLQDAEKAVEELKSCVHGLRDRLNMTMDGTTVVQKAEKPKEMTVVVQKAQKPDWKAKYE